MIVGTVVKLKIPLLNNNKGSIGICCDIYDSGSFFIFENGKFDGFSYDDQYNMLYNIGFSDQVSNYDFTNVMNLIDHFIAGRFNCVFNHDWQKDEREYKLKKLLDNTTI